MRTISIIALVLMLTGCAGTPDHSVLSGINSRVNAYKYIPDEGDVWSTPEQFYSRGGGDCEDFSIAKYHEVKKAMPDSKLEIAVVYDRQVKLYHAVLVVNNKWVLDNQQKKVYAISSYLFKSRYTVMYRTAKTSKPSMMDFMRGTY